MTSNNQQQIPMTLSNQQLIPLGIQPNDGQTTAQFANMNAQVAAAALLQTPHRLALLDRIDEFNLALFLIFLYYCWPILLFAWIFYLLVVPPNRSNQIPHEVAVDILRDAREEGRVASPTNEDPATVEEPPATQRDNHADHPTQPVTTAQTTIDIPTNTLQNVILAPTQNIHPHRSVESQETHSSESSDEDERIVSCGSGADGDDEEGSSNDEEPSRLSSIVENLSSGVRSHDGTNQNNPVNEQSNQLRDEAVDQREIITAPGDDIVRVVATVSRAPGVRARKTTLINQMLTESSDEHST